MDPLIVLMEEHAIILQALEALDKSVILLQNGDNVSDKFYSDFQVIAREFADRCHHGKEEMVLFPLISKKQIGQAESIADLLNDHANGRQYLVRLWEAVDNASTIGKIDNSVSYASLLRAHIKKENALFPGWISTLSREERDNMSERFEQIEEKVIGLGKHAEYLGKIKALNSCLVKKS